MVGQSLGNTAAVSGEQREGQALRSSTARTLRAQAWPQRRPLAHRPFAPMSHHRSSALLFAR